VTADVASSTTLSTTGCPPQDAGRTSFGVATPGSSSVTTTDCSVLFGSSNDSSALRTYQPDGRGTAMFGQPTELVSSGSANRMLDVDMATASIGWAVGEGSGSQRMYKTTDGGLTWTAVSDANDGLDGSAEGVDAVDTTTAWANRSNSNEIARTTNGTTWTKIVMEEAPAASINRVVAASANRAWALGCEMVSGHCRARIWLTDDGGNDWTVVWSDNTQDSEAMEGTVLSATSLYVATSAWATGSGVLRSTDGTTFTAVAPTSGNYRDVDAWDDTHVAAGASTGAVWVSSDGGSTWTPRWSPVQLTVRGLDYDSSGTIVAGYGDGSFARSTDDGATWTVLDQDATTGRAFSVDAVGTNRIVATLYSSSIVTSHDGGATWSLNSQAQTTNWMGIDGVDGGRMWRVGGPGHVQTSTDGGATWTAQASGTTKALRDVVATSRTSAVAVGSDGTIVRTVDSGTTWSAVTPPVAQTLRTVVASPWPWQSVLWAGGDAGTLLRSVDGGATWSVVTMPATAAPISAIAPWSATEVLVTALGDSPRAWTSTDAGTTWTARSTPGTDGINAAVAVPGTPTALVFDDRFVRRTTDGGATWTSVQVGSYPVFGADLAPDGTVWATGDVGEMWSSTDLGSTWQVWDGGSPSKAGYSVVGFSSLTAVGAFEGAASKAVAEVNGLADYDGSTASWTGTGFFGICLRDAPGTASSWPASGTCPQANGTAWRALPANGTLPAATAATTSAPGTTTVAFRFGLKVPNAQAPGTYVAPVAFEVTAPAA
jgi:photosystem II stability/assembly factor-like uncharacterized protein